MPDPIKDALRAACETDGLFGIKPEADRDIMRDRAAAVAAFLRALPDDVIIKRERIGYTRNDFAGMVEKAARDE